MKYDYLIVGSGLYGAMCAYTLTKKGYKCLVLEKRSHVGGNLYCENISGINVHKYGAHIFHTNNKEVWDFVNGLVPFNNYINSPLAYYNDKYYNLPFNMNTFYQLWNLRRPSQVKAELENQIKKFGVKNPANLEEQAINLVGKDIYEVLIKGYTEKQWGRPCTELPADIIKRIPVRFTYNNNYFNDMYQGIPIGGYNTLISKLLEGSDVLLNVDYNEDRLIWNTKANKVIYTGPIDAFYDYKYGCLDYRTVRFDTKVVDTPNYQGNAVINYTDINVPYTRCIEHKHFESFGPDVDANPNTVISFEYSTEWKSGMEPFYPINDEKNLELYKKYKALADKETKVEFGGRLAEYKYYDMDDIIEKFI